MERKAEKKILLFLVEGLTDMQALSLPVSHIFRDYNVRFQVIRTDVTSDESVTPRTIEKELTGRVDKFLAEYPFVRKGDIGRIVQLIDTDGAFVGPQHIKQAGDRRTAYSEEEILAKDKERLLLRNMRKRTIVYKLVHTQALKSTIPYEVYYFSRNMEHVLQKDASDRLTKQEKEAYAFSFADRYDGNEQGFLSLLGSDELNVPGTYEETWHFIMEGTASLRRYSNFYHLFRQLL